MRIPSLLLCAAAAGIAAPALAQTAPSDNPDAPRTPLPYDRGYDKPSARTDAINAAERPAVQAANNAARAASEAQLTIDQGRYDRDRAEYLDALRVHDRISAANERIYARQQRAYADAMRAWRIQVADCDAGVRAACTAPGPRPADFW
jgi:hypothetical protein